MKAYSIGRDESCDIVIDDSESLVSRKHALLKVFLTGKMELVDMSSNGTFVNGHAIARNKPYPVTRKDVITFARVKQLDWNLVPNYRRRIILCAVALLIVIAAILAIALWPESKQSTQAPPTSESPVPSVSDKTGLRDSTRKKENAAEDDEDLSMEEIQEMLRKSAPKPKHHKDKADDTKDSKDKKDGKTNSKEKPNQDKPSSTGKQDENNGVNDAID